MEALLRVLLVSWCFRSALFTNLTEEVRECVMELSCVECVPDHMPLVTSHAASAGRVRATHGDEVLLVCSGGKFVAYPMLESVVAACEGGRYRVRADGALRDLLELGCQEDIFEDVLHHVEHCAPPLQGRAYQTRTGGAGGGVRHLAAVCWDADRAAPVWARATNAPRNALPLAPHAHSDSPLSLLGNFNHMFDAHTRADAERLYSDDDSMTKRVAERMKHEQFSFGGESLTPARLLALDYFEDQNMRVTDFVSNKVPVWASVARGNLRHMQLDVARYMRQLHADNTIEVYTGVHGVTSLRTAAARREVWLKAGRFPVPRYVWTLVVDARRRRALALVVLNDPFVAVSEIRQAVFCESMCGRATWVRSLQHARNYEAPLYGLAFCCAAHEFATTVAGVPSHILRDVPPGPAGLLLD